MKVLAILSKAVVVTVLMALVVLQAEADKPVTVDVEVAVCLERPVPPSADLVLRCRGTWSGAVAGVAIAGPASGAAWTRLGTYGARAAASRAAEASSMTRIHRFANRYRVPWPSLSARRASDMSTHRVYQIYGPAKSGSGSRVYKYGITKNSDYRPRRQLRACRAAFGTDCTYSWVRNGVDGWTRARKVEAGYATKYKMRFNRCPPGMVKCL